MVVTAEEVNVLVYRYLQESGCMHSAFTFACESLVTKSTVAITHAESIPPGSLISLIQKGLMYLQVEQHLNEDCCVSDDSGKDIGMTSILSTKKSIKYSAWRVKHDKNREEEDGHEASTHKRTRLEALHKEKALAEPGVSALSQTRPYRSLARRQGKDGRHTSGSDIFV